MSHQSKNILEKIITYITIMGAVITAIFYLADMKADAKVAENKISVLESGLSAAVGVINTIDGKVIQQDKGIQRVENYIEFGILPRLELDKKKILEEAAKSNNNGSSTSMKAGSPFSS